MRISNIDTAILEINIILGRLNLSDEETLYVLEHQKLAVMISAARKFIEIERRS